MVALVTCIACQYGDHSNHVEWVSKPPEGMCGGAICKCQGDCSGNRPKQFLDLAVDLYADLSLIDLPGEEVEPTVTTTEAMDANTTGRRT